MRNMSAADLHKLMQLTIKAASGEDANAENLRKFNEQLANRPGEEANARQAAAEAARQAAEARQQEAAARAVEDARQQAAQERQQREVEARQAEAQRVVEAARQADAERTAEASRQAAEAARQATEAARQAQIDAIPKMQRDAADLVMKVADGRSGDVDGMLSTVNKAFRGPFQVLHQEGRSRSDSALSFGA